MSVSEHFKLSVSLVFGSLVENEVFKELEVCLRETFVCEVGIFCEDISGNIVVLIFEVKKNQVGEGLCGKRRVFAAESSSF